MVCTVRTPPTHPPAVLWGGKQQVRAAQCWGLWEGIQEGFLAKAALSGDLKDQ